MEVIVKSSPKIEIELATKVVKVGGGGKVTVDSALSTTSENPVQNKVVTAELGKNPFEKGSGENSSVLKGGDNISTGELSTALGRRNESTGVFSYSEGEFNTASGVRAHAEGCYVKAEGADSHAENEGCIARGINSHAEGYYTLASGITSHAEGASRADDPEYNPDSPAYATVEKYLEARGQRSHAEGYATQAFGNQSHAEGIDTLAEGTNSHAEGQETQALKNNSHAEGNRTVSEAADSHAEGYKTQAKGWASHAEGIETVTTNAGEHACGLRNASTKSTLANEATIFSVGVGTPSSGRKNAFEVKQNGDIYIEGVEGKIQDKLNATDILDTQLTELSNKVDNLPQGEEFDKEGNYPSLRVGTADDLAGRGESVPASFGFRASGGKSIKDGRAYIKAIKGNSVVWNQKVKRLNYVSNGVSSNCEGNVITLNGVCTTTWAPVTQGINVIQDHKYLVVGHVLTNPNGLSFNISLFNNVPRGAQFNANTNFNWSIGVCSGSRLSGFGVDGFPSGTDLTGIQFRTIVIDLTQMFGAGYEPSTIEDFNARVATLGVDMYAYNGGEVIHCNTESIKSVGDNAWDEEWEVGSVDINTGANLVTSSQIRCKEPIRIIGGATYYAICSVGGLWITFFDKDGKIIEKPSHSGGTAGNAILVRKDLSVVFTAPQNAVTMKFYTEVSYGTTYNHDIMITLVHSGWKQDTDAGYQPYWQDTLPLPIIRKYFPNGMKKAGSAHDEIRYNKASGKWEYSKGRIKSVDLGTFNWIASATSDSTKKRFVSLTKVDGVVLDVLASDRANMLCKAYATISANDTYLLVKGIALRSTGDLVIYDNTITTAESLVSSLQGVILYYESNDWEWVELDAEDQNFRDYYKVADFGTEMSQSNNVPSAPFSADIIYQFNAVDMIREHELEITELQKVIATMQAQLASLTSNNA